MNKYSHIFAICAYKESPYLEECIQSVLSQTVKCGIIIITSTPNEYISHLAEKYALPLYINEGKGGITQDWNFAYHQAAADVITITHQDDVYLPGYAEEIQKLMKSGKRPLIAFTDYGELRKGKTVPVNRLLRVKRVMLFPLRFKFFQRSRFCRRRILSLGSPICCPAVSYMKSNLPETIFRDGFRSDEDWEAWEMLSKLKGEFLYSKKIAMYHRIHEGSETTAILGDNARTKEDFIMFCKFWPKPIARILAKGYSSSEKSNKL